MMSSTKPLNRRGCLGLLGGGAGAMALGSFGSPLQASSEKITPSGPAPLTIVDFHNHHVNPSFPLTILARVPPSLRTRWEQVNRNLHDSGALLSSIEASGIAARVINTPTAFIQGPDGEVPPGTIQRINDLLAELVGKNPGRLYGLATVDAYSGEAGARELTRAVRELGLRGAFVDSAKGDVLIDAPQARPTLAAAANLNVPVFVHPVSDPALLKKFASRGWLGLSLARGSINAAALFALIESGAFDELPDLRVVVTTLALGGVLVAGGVQADSSQRATFSQMLRRHVYVDTMGLNPTLIRGAIDLLGAEHVLVGTDWPIFVEKSVPERLHRAFAECGLSPAEQQMVASGNTLRLLGVVK